MIHVMQDLRFAIRMLRKTPIFSSVAVLALAVGIGANTAIFGAIFAVLLRPLPYSDSDRLVKIWETRTTVAKGRVSPADFADWKRQAGSFEQLAAYRTNDYNLLNVDEPEQIPGAAVSANVFSVLRVHPVLGREFTPAEEAPGSSNVVLLSHRLWVRRFASDPTIIGRTLKFDANLITVVGVMPAGFFFPTPETELWVPLAINPDSPMAGRGMHLLEVVGRLKPGVSPAHAGVEMRTIAARLEKEYPRDNTGHGAGVLRLQDDLTETFRSSLLLLFGAVIVVLLIACADVANLQLVRATARRKEIAVRLALGATRSRIVQQLLTESVLLSMIGAALGLIIALSAIRLLLAVSPSRVPRLADSHLDPVVLLFTLGVAMMSGILFGLAPALGISRADPSHGLADAGRGSSTGRSTHALRNTFVVIEVTLAAVLLTGAGLFIKSFSQVIAIQPGFRTQHVLVADVSLAASHFRGPQRAAFVQRVLEELRSNPQVGSAGAVTHLPLARNGPIFDFNIEGQPAAPPGEDFKAQLRAATPGYFQAIGIPLVAGRTFEPEDLTGTPAVVVINDVMAKRYWPRESPLGKRISFDAGDDGVAVWRQIVGVVQGVRASRLEVAPEPQMYAPFAQFSMPFASFAVQSSSDRRTVTAEIRRAVAKIDRNEPVSNIRTMDEVTGEATSARRASALLLGIFAAIALVLASIGIYGVLAYAITQHTKEIGIRVALGAQPAHVIRLVVADGMRLAFAGVAIGLIASLALGRTVRALLYGVHPNDPVVLIGTAMLLCGISALACVVPARRALRISALAALRQE